MNALSTLPIALIVILLNLQGCFGDPFSESKIKDMYVNFWTSKGPGQKFYWENIIELKNFKKTKGVEAGPTKHVVEFTFDRVFKINASDIEKKFSSDELTKAFGDKKKEAVFNLVQKDFKAGTIDASPHLAMVLEKTDAGWVVKEVGFPNN